MNRKKGTKSQLIAVVLSVVLITTSIPPREVEASWFSNLVGGLFTIVTSPILLFAPNNPTLRKNNPFRSKESEDVESVIFTQEALKNKYNVHPRFPIMTEISSPDNSKKITKDSLGKSHV
jgi:hypothetical protein